MYHPMVKVVLVPNPNEGPMWQGVIRHPVTGQICQVLSYGEDIHPQSLHNNGTGWYTRLPDIPWMRACACLARAAWDDEREEDFTPVPFEEWWRPLSKEELRLQEEAWHLLCNTFGYGKAF